MRLSTRLILNASTTYARLAVSFVLGIFFTWYVVGKIGMIGLGTIGLVSATFGLAASVELAIRQSLIRELAAAIATGERERIRKSLTAAVALCLPTAAVAFLIAAALGGLAYIGFFNTEEEVARLPLALCVMLLCEGVHVAIRVILSPYTQSLYAAQRVATDNALQLLLRVLHAGSAVLVFGYWLPGEPVATQLMGYALTRATIQTADIFLGTLLAKMLIPGLRLSWRDFDRKEFRATVSTVWHTGQVTLLMNLNVQAVTIIINLFFGLTYNGIWQVVVQLGGGIRLLAEGLMRGIEPLSAHLQHEGKQAAIKDLMLRSIRYQLLVTLPLVVGVLVFMTPILNLWVAGRMRNDANLEMAGIEVPEAIQIIATLSYIYLAAAVIRTSVRGVERSLYGLGHVRAYAWFAKYAFTINLATASLLMWLIGSPLGAPLSLLITYLLYYPGVVMRAAWRCTEVSPGQAWKGALPRPLAAAAILTALLLLVRPWLESLTLWSLLSLVLAAAAVYSRIVLALGLVADERRRLLQMVRRR
ncbi:MAG: lipopolysaccharide biosynthesis protein [Phycisphaerales bacterium JB038]